MKKDSKPLKRGTRVIPEGKKQVNLNVEETTLEKIKQIALKEGVPFTEIYNLAFAKFIELYERKNGPIKYKRAEGLTKL